MIKLKSFPIVHETVLKQKSEPIKDAKEAEEIRQELIYMFPNEGAYAVCAVQLGIHKRATLIKFPSHNKKPGEEPVYTFVCNPTIAKWSDMRVFVNEGCLSFPKKYKNTMRFNKVTVTYQDVLDGELDERALILDGIDAVIAQHEVDHMEGIVFLDRAKKVEPIRSIKIGRNQHCPCGSGKKYKKCCIGDGD